MTLAHVDLCAGIGGFSLGFSWSGLSAPVLFCEIDPWCRKVLAKHWPDVPIAEDVKDLANDPDGLIPKCDIITAGYPCQPFSFAGERRGTTDDRHIWPHIFSIVQAKRPAWCVFENVYGHVSMGLDQVLSDLEREGYATRPFIIPACAVDAPHKRDRVWIVAHADSESEPDGTKHEQRLERANNVGNSDSSQFCWDIKATEQGGRQQGLAARRKNVADTNSAGQQQSNQEMAREPSEQSDSSGVQPGQTVADTEVMHSNVSAKHTEQGQRQEPQSRDSSGEVTVAHAASTGLQGAEWPKHEGHRDRLTTSSKDVADTNVCELQRRGEEQVYGQPDIQKQSERGSKGEPTQRSTLSGLGGMADGIPRWLDEPRNTPRTVKGVKGRADRLKGLGNAIVPQIAQRIGETIKSCEDDNA